MSDALWFDPYGSCPLAGRPQRVRRQIRRFKTLRRRQARYEGKRIIRRELMDQMALFDWQADDAPPPMIEQQHRPPEVEQLPLF